MRAIKFRVPHFHANNGSFSHFMYWGTIDALGKPSLDGGVFTSPGSNNMTRKGWHEQFTGLHDKNGKEIYEGDIVTCQTSRLKYPHKGEVIYLPHICGFGITTEPIMSESTGQEVPAVTYFNLNENFEVIGNIHQNPELL